MKSSHRIVYNTGVLYAKLLIIMFVGLFSVRLILSALGETNYGIYSLVAGVVAMLAVLQSAMSRASMRFMSHSLGSNDELLILKTFNTTLLLHIVMGLLVVLIIEIGGLIMFHSVLDIPEDKIFDAKVIFHFMAVTTFVTIIAVPYDAVINSHENLLALSIVDVFGAILKLGVAIYLTYSPFNLLIFYGFSIMIIQIILRFIKQRYSIMHYKECKLNFKEYYNKTLAKTILSFSGWNLFGSLTSMSVTQVRSILLNMFFGVDLNAANGVAMQVTSHVNTFSSSMTRALNPQLVKSEGGGDRIRMLKLTELATKFSVFLFALFAVPVIIEMPYLFNIWLKEVPEYAIIFSRLILIGLLSDKFSFEITSAIRAVGTIRKLTVTESIIMALNIPISYTLFKLHYPPYSIFIVTILFSILIFFERLYFGRTVAGMNIPNFVKKTILPLLVTIIPAALLGIAIHLFLNEGWIRLIIVIFIFIIAYLILFRYLCLNKNEFDRMKEIILAIFSAKKLKKNTI